jgi:hypothetical protein
VDRGDGGGDDFSSLLIRFECGIMSGGPAAAEERGVVAFDVFAEEEEE